MTPVQHPDCVRDMPSFSSPSPILVSDALQTLRDAARDGRIDPTFCQSIGTEFLAFANPSLSPNLITTAPDLLAALNGLMDRISTMYRASYTASGSVKNFFREWLPGGEDTVLDEAVQLLVKLGVIVDERCSPDTACEAQRGTL
ncbi:MAG: hypothetical protein HQL84_17055 [Magnetococcales bacterium]|nr:hypothetical protein [Magnetococcales bacterium]